MSITTMNEEQLASILTNGMLAGVKNNLKHQLMTTLEKEVDAAINKTLDQFKGYVSANYDCMTGVPTFHISINGIKQNENLKVLR
jgi:predicted 2-oxoglutarate/Fe(II)-dependent dioxygenase YbiX